MSHINEIATQANREGKVKKREAFTALTRLAEIVDEEAVPSMATLYRYFLPDPPKRPKTDYEWVCWADVPLSLQYLKEAVPFTPEDAFVCLSYASPTDPVLLSFADGRGAVIMPVKR